MHDLPHFCAIVAEVFGTTFLQPIQTFTRPGLSTVAVIDHGLRRC